MRKLIKGNNLSIIVYGVVFDLLVLTITSISVILFNSGTFNFYSLLGLIIYSFPFITPISIAYSYLFLKLNKKNLNNTSYFKVIIAISLYLAGVLLYFYFLSFNFDWLLNREILSNFMDSSFVFYSWIFLLHTAYLFYYTD